MARIDRQVLALLTSEGFALARVGKHYIFRDDNGVQVVVAGSPRRDEYQLRRVRSNIRHARLEHSKRAGGRIA